MDPRNDERLTAYIDGLLSQEEVERLEDELAADPKMNELLGEMRVVRELIQRVSQEEAPKTLYDRVMGAVDTDAARSRGSFLPSGMGLPLATLMLAATFLLVMNQVLDSLKLAAATQATAPPPPTVQMAGQPPSAVDAPLPAPNPPGPPPSDARPYYMAPDAYRFTGPGVFAALQAAATAANGKLVDKAGNPVTAPNASGEVWVELDASQVRAFRYALEGRVRIDMIGIARVIEGPQRMRLLVEETP